MSTDLTTTLCLVDNKTDDGLRVCRNPEGELRVYAADGAFDPRTWLFTEEDAIMLRDWLNDEWPVADAVPAEPEEYLWGAAVGWPQEGCPCPDCEKVRGR